ncbi:hypothetical protein EUTSA_v10029317mg [Eutrema salsugineum]|uniref:F-box domain-containing protein n=1 Tax=Eutrema salsugineum TaxID=72664 RepID=V4L8J1_EUTSA|nr:F-box/kelch-repeat protein At4g38940 [Eutrema salsugineum]ESQ38677.1 hypothetical protein EUTSA_v10029317mg [Eutrema salsugineum]
MSFKVRAKKEHSPSMITSLPYDIIMNIIACVPRCYYPTISLVSKIFRSLVASPELYKRRSLLGCTEHCLYGVLYNYDTSDYRLYILRRKVNSNDHYLVMIPSLRFMPFAGRYVPVGSKIYVVGHSNALSIDCRFHTLQPISPIPKPMSYKAAGIVEGKIYVIGECNDEVSGSRWWKRVMVFDTETEMWEPKMIKPGMELGDSSLIDGVVMEDKICMRNYENSFVYGPEEGKWEKDEMLNAQRWKELCVVDGLLYFYDVYKKKLRAYDPKQRCWRVVTGLEELLPKITGSWRMRTVGYGVNLAHFFHKYNDARTNTTVIWCVG